MNVRKMVTIPAKHYIVNYEEFHKAQNPELFDKTLELLGDRLECMFYLPAKDNEGGAYIGDVIVGATGTLGLEVAAALKTMMPVCSNWKFAPLILVTDHTDLSEVHDFMKEENGRWYTEDSTVYIAVRGTARMVQDIVTSFEDERYLIVLRRKLPERDILMDIYKK